MSDTVNIKRDWGANRNTVVRKYKSLLQLYIISILSTEPKHMHNAIV